MTNYRLILRLLAIFGVAFLAAFVVIDGGSLDTNDTIGTPAGAGDSYPDRLTKGLNCDTEGLPTAAVITYTDATIAILTTDRAEVDHAIKVATREVTDPNIFKVNALCR